MCVGGVCVFSRKSKVKSNHYDRTERTVLSLESDSKGISIENRNETKHNRWSDLFLQQWRTQLSSVEKSIILASLTLNILFFLSNPSYLVYQPVVDVVRSGKGTITSESAAKLLSIKHGWKGILQIIIQYKYTVHSKASVTKAAAQPTATARQICVCSHVLRIVRLTTQSSPLFFQSNRTRIHKQTRKEGKISNLSNQRSIRHMLCIEKYTYLIQQIIYQ